MGDWWGNVVETGQNINKIKRFQHRSRLILFYLKNVNGIRSVVENWK